MPRRLAAVLAAFGLVLLLAAPAWATTEPLHQGTPIAWNDPSIEVQCDAGDNTPSGMVTWHFVAHTTTDDFTMDATFGDGTTITDMDPTKIVDSYELHWDVTTSLTTLDSASITGSGTVDAGGFNLSHVCPNPGEEIPEAPASALLLATSGLIAIGFLFFRMRRREEPV